jgi:predicted neutral ceramidase superfamily lipid hydrolase
MASEGDFTKFKFVSLASPTTAKGIFLNILVGLGFGFGINATIWQSRVLDSYLLALTLILLSMASSLAVNKIVPRFKLNWAFFITAFNQILLLIALAGSMFSSRLTIADALSVWAVLAFTIWMLAFIGLAGLRIRVRAISMALAQPVLTMLLTLSALAFPPIAVVIPIMSFAIGATFVILLLLFSDHLFSLAFYGISGFVELSHFLKGVRGEQVSISFGHHINALIQAFKISNSQGESFIVAPWLHSGPLRSVGGGSLSTNLIHKLNKTNPNSYCLHVPSNHEFNPSADVSGRIVKAIKEANANEAKLMASELVEVELNGFEAYGMRLNDTFFISFSNKDIDDYAVSVFTTIRAKFHDKKIMFIDSHPNYPLKNCSNVEVMSKEAKDLDDLVGRLIGVLEKKKQYPAKTGFAFKKLEDISAFALTLEFNKNRYLFFAADTNGWSPGEQKKISKLASSMGIDKTLLFTTDSHSMEIKRLIQRDELPESVIRECIIDSRNTSDTKLGFIELNIPDVKILGKAYYELLTAVRLMTRILPVLYIVFLSLYIFILWSI